MTITADEMRLIVELPPDTNTRAVTEAIKELYPGTELYRSTIVDITDR